MTIRHGLVALNSSTCVNNASRSAPSNECHKTSSWPSGRARGDAGAAQAASSALLNKNTIHFRNILHPPTCCDKHLAGQRPSSAYGSRPRKVMLLLQDALSITDRVGCVKHRLSLVC